MTFTFKNIYQLWDASTNDWKLLKQFNKDYQRNPMYVSNKIMYSKCETLSAPDENFPRTIYDSNTGNILYTFTMDDCKDSKGTITKDIFVKPIEDDSKLLVIRDYELRIYDISKLLSNVSNQELNK